MPKDSEAERTGIEKQRTPKELYDLGGRATRFVAHVSYEDDDNGLERPIWNGLPVFGGVSNHYHTGN